MSDTLERREVPRIYLNLHASVFDTSNGYGRFFRAYIIDLSCWGCKMQFQHPIDIYDSFTVTFHFNEVEYTLPLNIMEELNGNIYRIKFIFADLLTAKSLQLNIEKYMDIHHLKKNAKQSNLLCVTR